MYIQSIHGGGLTPRCIRAALSLGLLTIAGCGDIDEPSMSFRAAAPGLERTAGEGNHVNDVFTASEPLNAAWEETIDNG